MSRSLLVLFAATVICFNAIAQTATGNLQGRVTDASGSSVPAAKVTIVNQATGIEKMVASNTDGNFIQPFLLPGDYRVTVEKEGFDKWVTSDIRVGVEQAVSLQVSMKVGSLATTVEVSAQGTLLDTANATLSTVLASKQFLDLPLSGRNPMSLVTLTPGVISGNGASTPWISGGRNGESEITVDGTTIILPENNVSLNTTGYMPILDSVEEASVVTNSLAAEYGRTGGGTINFATRGGTNALHGSGFEFMRNSALNANSWSNNRNGVKKTVNQDNQFGGTVGGPVWIPHLISGKNKTFFFFSEQSERARNTSSNTMTTPLPQWLQGNFSGIVNGSNQPITIYDPLTGVDNGQNTSTAVRQPFPGNIVPQNRFDPVAAGMLKYYPAPNATPINQYNQQNNFYLAGKYPSRDDKFDSRIDQNFSEKLRMFARGSYERSYSGVFDGFGPGNLASSSVTNGGPVLTYDYNITTNWIYTFNPTTILNVNAGYNHFNTTRYPISEGICPASLGFPSSMDAIAKIDNCEFPNISVGGYSGGPGMPTLGQATYTTLLFKPATWTLKADLTKIHGNHAIKFGGEFRKLFMNFTQQGLPDGQFSFSQGFTQAVNTAGASSTQGFGLASFLLGTMSGASMSHTIDIAEASAYWGIYLQDDWKISPKLTLNIGARWELDTPRTERFNRLSYFDIHAPSPIGSSVAVAPGVNCPGCGSLTGAMMYVTPSHRTQVPADTNNVGPRLGLAYQINPKTTFRAAYAIMYSGSVLQAAGTSGSSGTEGFTSTTNGTPTYDNGETVNAYFRDPFLGVFNLPQGAASNGKFTGPYFDIGNGVGESFFSDNANPMIQQWNGTLQREVKGGMLLQAGYLGGTQHHLIDGENMIWDQAPDQYLALGSALNAQVANPFNGIIQSPTSPYYNRATVNAWRLLTPYPQYSGINAYRKPGANANYNSFIASVQKRFANGLSYLFSYTGGKLLDDASQVVNFLGATGSKQDAYFRRGEKAVSAQDVSRQLKVSFNYELPVGRHGHFLHSAPKAADFVIGGWQVNGIYTYQTGQPIVIGNGGNSANIGAPGIRPSVICDPKVSGGIGSRLTDYFNQACFVQTPNFAFGTEGRFLPDIRNPSFHNLDASMFKNFRFHETATVQFRAEAFNFFNHPTWSGPNTSILATGASGFGTVTSKSGNRSVQLAMRVTF